MSLRSVLDAKLLFGTALLIVGLGGARANSILFDNLSAPLSGGNAAGSMPLFASFSTGASAANLTNVTVILSNFSNGPNDNNSIQVQLFANDGLGGDPLLHYSPTGPGTLLYNIASVPDSSLTDTATPFSLTLATPQLLSADTRYWIELTAPVGSTGYWDFTGDSNGIGVFNEFNNVFSPGTEGPGLPGGVGRANFDIAPYLMEVTATDVPEPASLCLLGVAAAVTILGRRVRFD